MSDEHYKIGEYTCNCGYVGGSGKALAGHLGGHQLNTNVLSGKTTLRRKKDKLEAENATLRADLQEIKRLSAEYKRRPIDIHDRPESWGRLEALLEAIDAARESQ